MRILLEANREEGDLVVIGQYLSNRELETFSEILYDFSSEINKSLEFQLIKTPTQWTFLFYDVSVIDYVIKQLSQEINKEFGIEVVEVREL